MARIWSVAGCMVALATLASPAQAHHAKVAQAPVSASCYRLVSVDAARYLERTASGEYAATGHDPARAEAFRFLPTGLGRMLIIAPDGKTLTGGPGAAVRAAASASTLSDWQVLHGGKDTIRIASPEAGSVSAARTLDGRVLLTPATSGDAVRFKAVSTPIAKCAAAPEVEVNASGPVRRGATPMAEVAGLLDTHLHLMGFEFLGGRVHCGRPWSPQGVTVALADCPDHYPNGSSAVLENFFSNGTPFGTHDPVGWPTFRGWPAARSVTHEQTYHKWVERAWRGGMRLMINLLVDNEVLCEVYPLKQNPCNDMNSVRLQARRTRELEAFIDEQSGGPGRGWFRIVTTPFQARRVINQGKLAVVLGIEVSRLFGCGIYNDVPECTRADIDRQLEEVWNLGVRDMEIVNKFDNALAGVAFDSGAGGVFINTVGNKRKTGKYWQAEHCEGPATDREITPGATGRDELLGTALGGLVPAGPLPVYPEPPHCNVIGLSTLGDHLIRRMAARGMIIDPDHMSVLARKQTLNIVESLRYSGVVSSHSWSDVDAEPRILKAGGVIGPYAGSSKGFVREWRRIKKLRSPKYYWGIGFGPDMNGFGQQGEARHGPNPVQYPFKSFDGSVTFDRQRSGQRVFDINADGVAHYGLYPDWVEDLRMQAGDAIMRDLSRGPEAYLQMWERAVGVPATRCVPKRAIAGRNGVGAVTLLVGTQALLRRAGQPLGRGDGRTWRYCISGNKGARVTAVLSRSGVSQLVLTNGRLHIGDAVRVGARASALTGPARRSIGGGVRLGRIISSTGRIVYLVRGGRVRSVGVVSRKLSKQAVRAAVRLAARRVSEARS